MAPAKKAAAKKARARKTASDVPAPVEATPTEPTPAEPTLTEPTLTEAPPVAPPAPEPTPEPGAPAARQPSPWSAAELARIRATLVTQRAEMQGDYDHTVEELDTLARQGSDHAGDDQADAGAKTFEREQELSITANRLDLIEQIGHAIERIDSGEYGFCENCGKPIPKERLELHPTATLDVACKQLQERR